MTARLRTPYFFLLLSMLAAVLSLLPFHIGVVAAVIVIIICFERRIAAVLICAYFAFTFISSHSAFVTDVRHLQKHTEYRTTKGKFKSGEAEYRIGDLLWGKFERSVDFNGRMPRQIYSFADDYEVFRVFPVSNLLEARKKQAAELVYRSGGKIHTTPAHIYAVRDYIPAELSDQYIITGLAHLLAMSGFHVGIFTAGIFILFFFLPRKLRVFPAFILLPLLIPLSGFAVTVERAVVFALVYLAAWLAGLKVNSVRFVFFLAAVFILLSPFSLFSISFLLSFCAVFGIVTIFNRRYNPVTSIVSIGIASSVLILPLQLYFFGNANMVSVITTVILTPVVWVQMIAGLLASVIPGIMIAPLALIERFSEWLMSLLAAPSWYFMYVSKPPTSLLVVAFVVAFALALTRYRLFALLIFLVPLLPVYPKNVLYFPELSPSPKGYILSGENGSEIFYQGMHSTFVYKMLPAAAELGIKSFDRGKIRIFDGENLYLKVKEEGLSGTVCVNEDEGCPYVYMTRSNTIKPPLAEKSTYIVYKNKYRDPKIIIQSEAGAVWIDLEEK